MAPMEKEQVVALEAGSGKMFCSGFGSYPIVAPSHGKLCCTDFSVRAGERSGGIPKQSRCSRIGITHGYFSSPRESC